MANDQQKKHAERSPQAPATRGELYFGFLIIWLFLALAFGQLLSVEPSWQRALFFGVSFLVMLVHGVIFVGMWWVSRRERDGD